MTHYTDQREYAVRCEWDTHGVTSLERADICIVVDVLSFCTTVEIAVANGATVLPCRDAAMAAEYAAAHDALLVSGRSRWPSQWSISPQSMLTIPAGTRVVVPSPNGSRLSALASEGGSKVAAGSLRNARAVARWAAQHGKTVALVPAGERWNDGTLRPALEDMIGAGAIIRHLPGTRSPNADAAVALFVWAETRLTTVLSELASGRELVERGYSEDVSLAAMLDCSNAVPFLQDGAFVNAGSEQVFTQEVTR